MSRDLRLQRGRLNIDYWCPVYYTRLLCQPQRSLIYPFLQLRFSRAAVQNSYYDKMGDSEMSRIICALQVWYVRLTCYMASSMVPTSIRRHDGTHHSVKLQTDPGNITTYILATWRIIHRRLTYLRVGLHLGLHLRLHMLL